MSVVSVIVPVYNVSSYLRECVESICRQTYSEIEIILCDDGSTDGSGELCDQLAKEDSRIIVFHQKNAGVSAARNHALQQASGDFVCFVDSDDFVAEDYVEKLLNNLLRSGADLSVCSLYSLWKNCQKPASHMPEQEVVWSSDEYSQLFWTWLGLYATASCKMFRKSLFDTIGFPEGKIFEDMICIGNLLKTVKKISFFPEPLYYYRMRKSSIINRDRQKLCEGMFEATGILINLFSEDSGLAYLAQKQRYNQLLIYYIDKPKDRRSDWKKKLAACRKELLQSPHLSKKVRMKLYFTAIAPVWYSKWKEKQRKVTFEYYE